MTVIKITLINICLFTLMLSACGISYSEGERLHEQGKYIEAIAEFDKYLETNRYERKPRLLRADSYIKLGTPEKALYDLFLVKELRLRTDGVLNTPLLDLVQGNFYVAIEEFDWAIAYYTKVIVNDDEYLIDAYMNRGSAYESTGDYQKAQADFNMVERLESE